MASGVTLKDIVKKNETSTRDHTERLIHMTQAMEAHIEADRVAFETLGGQIIEVNKDVKSLLASRSFLRGTWFAVGVFGTFIAAVSGLLIAAWPHIVTWVR